MIATFTALLAAHVVADFVLQPDWMVARKRNPFVLLLHVLVVLATAQVATGTVADPALMALAGAHLVIDAVKLRLSARLATFLGDQAAHLFTIAAAAAWQPDLWSTGVWSTTAIAAPLLHAMLLCTAAVVATRVGGFVVAFIMGPGTPFEEKGLPDGGKKIGFLERALIFVLLLANQIDTIGFLIAAKSVLRFGAISSDRAASEYVIIGTLASFGWAIAVTLAALTLRDLLPPLELLPASP